MKIFESDGKVNFVDRNNVVLGYDMVQDCCEHANWFIADCITITTTLSGKINDELNAELEEYIFDTTYFQDVSYLYPQLDEGKLVVFRIVKRTKHGWIDDNSEKFIHLFNVHNGYYGHGFECKHNGQVLQEGSC